MTAILRALLLLWLLKVAARAVRWTTAAAVLILAWPVTAAAAVTFTAAWLLGWPPARLFRAAAASPAAAVFLIAAAMRHPTWQGVALSVPDAWDQASRWLVHGRVPQAVALTTPLAVPAGLLAGGAAWAQRCASMAAGAAGRHAYAPAAFDARQWHRQARAARGRLAAPGPFPLVTSRATVPAGAKAGNGQRPGESRMVPAPREYWTWAADGNEHPALVSMDLWEQAQATGARRGNIADHTAPPQGRRVYPLRARITCGQCHRRMCGITTAETRAYYVCPHNPNNPRDAINAPGHIRAAFRDRAVYAVYAVYAAIDAILRPLLSEDRDSAYTAQIPAAQAEQDARTSARTAQLQKTITQADIAINGLMTQLEQLGSDNTPAANAYRDRIRDQFNQRYEQRAAAQAELDKLTASQPPADDPSLITELPHAARLLADAPPDIRARLYAAFQVHVLYRAPKHQATITATITDATPAIIRQLLADTRTDHDTHHPAPRKNLPQHAIAGFFTRSEILHDSRR